MNGDDERELIKLSFPPDFSGFSICRRLSRTFYPASTCHALIATHPLVADPFHKFVGPVSHPLSFLPLSCCSRWPPPTNLSICPSLAIIQVFLLIIFCLVVWQWRQRWTFVTWLRYCGSRAAHGISITCHHMKRNAKFYHHASLKLLNAISLSSCLCKLILDFQRTP